MYVTEKGPDRKGNEETSAALGDSDLAEFCTSSLSQHINTELCTHSTQVAMVYRSSFNQSQVISTAYGLFYKGLAPSFP